MIIRRWSPANDTTIGERAVSIQTESTPRRVPPALRFEVLKRDAFTCQYCGRRPPDVVLHVDHVEPKAGGGFDDILNLVTACAACNLGKSDRRLSDQTILAKQIEQAAALSERREQVEMLASWKRGLRDCDEQTIAVVKDWWLECIEYRERLTLSGMDQLRRAVKKYGATEVMESIEEATRIYLQRDEDKGGFIHESVVEAFKRITGVAKTRAICVEKPYWRQILYIRGIIRNRFDIDYRAGAQLLSTLDAYASYGANFDQIEELAKTTVSYGEFLYLAQEHTSEMYEPIWRSQQGENATEGGVQ